MKHAAAARAPAAAAAAPALCVAVAVRAIMGTPGKAAAVTAPTCL